MSLGRVKKWINKVKAYIILVLREEPVRMPSLIRHCIGVLLCSVVYKASIADYFELRYFEKPHKIRKTYFTASDARRFIRLVNGSANNRRYADKTYMYRALGRFTKREQLFCPPASFAEFEDFFRRHGKAVYKTNDTFCGTGVELWQADETDLTGLYNKAVNNDAVLDELVIQHPALARLNPDTVNTVKIFTFLVDDECEIVAAEFRMGRIGTFVDNIESGGIAAGVDVKTGRIVGDAYDIRLNSYSHHPDTGVGISGMTLPHWDEVLRFTEECARSCPLSYAEWDIAIRENDCVLIEANPNARNCGIQTGAFSGRKAQFIEFEKRYLQAANNKLLPDSDRS